MTYKSCCIIASNVNTNIEIKQIKPTLINILVLSLMPRPDTILHLAPFRYNKLDTVCLMVFDKAYRKSLGIGNPILGDKW